MGCIGMIGITVTAITAQYVGCVGVPRAVAGILPVAIC
jgi:hypothetical protein